jgi:hypothetical protein
MGTVIADQRLAWPAMLLNDCSQPFCILVIDLRHLQELAQAQIFFHRIPANNLVLLHPIEKFLAELFVGDRGPLLLVFLG